MRTVFCFIIVLVFSTFTTLAQQRSVKRGVGWDEKLQPMTNAPVDKMSPGICWYYNWGLSPQGNVTNVGPGLDMEYVPMCWNGGFNETTLRNYLNAHPGVKYLLGFNEPNFSSQANMTPQKAAEAWPKLEKIADDYGLQLVAPALNFSGEKVGGRTWNPYEWYDEFFRLLPEAKLDYLALHCYMNWYSATTWFATEYFYKDLYDTSKTDVYGRYPNLKAFLDNYRMANGHFPLMFLTEFCSWENDGTISSVNFQIDQMTQKVQKLEQSDLVAAYAWFMGNAASGASSYPYMSIFQTNNAASDLSELGRVYVYMSSFDTTKYYAPDETVWAKDYVDASLDNQQPRLRSNTDAQTNVPLQVEMQSGTWLSYQFTLPSDGDYTLKMRMKSGADNSFRVYQDAFGSANAKLKTTLTSTSNLWQDVEMTVPLSAGQHHIIIYNGASTSMYLNSLMLSATQETAIGTVDAQRSTLNAQPCYTLSGILLNTVPQQKGIYIQGGHKRLVR